MTKKDEPTGDVPPAYRKPSRLRELGPDRKAGFSKQARDPNKAKAEPARLVPVTAPRKVYV